MEAINPESLPYNQYGLYYLHSGVGVSLAFYTEAGYFLNRKGQRFGLFSKRSYMTSKD